MSPPPIGHMGRWLNGFGQTISGPGSSAPIVPPPPEPDSIIRRVIDAGQSLVRWPARFTQAAPQLLLNSITTRDGQMEIARRMAEGIRFRIGTQDDFEYFVNFFFWAKQ